MISMTGYGKGEFRTDGLEVTVELKSVNNRFLDIAVKSPRIFLGAEEDIRAAIRRKLSRGHVDVFVNYTDKREREKCYYVDWNAARAYVKAAEEFAERFPAVKNDASLTFFLRLPDVVRPEENVSLDSVLYGGLMAALDAALEALDGMRRKEGERLKADLLTRVAVIAGQRDKIALLAPQVAEDYRKKLTARITEYLGGKVDETRILTEAAAFADKCNIDEELTRLASHIEEFYSICKTEPVGRKLDFLIQEFNRECNTICSKSASKEITAVALAMKNEIEKIREQIQNLE